MQHSAVFFGGVVLGGILSAACGFDLYESREENRQAIGALRGEIDRVEEDLGAAREDRSRILTQKVTVEKRVRVLEADLDHSQAVQAGVEAERDEFRDRLEETELLAQALDQQLADLRILAQRQRQDIERLVLRYFAVPRPESDTDLVLEFFRVDGTLEAQRDLVLSLCQHSPEILLSLNCHPRATRTLESFFRLDQVGVVPTSAEIDSVAN